MQWPAQADTLQPAALLSCDGEMTGEQINNTLETTFPSWLDLKHCLTSPGLTRSDQRWAGHGGRFISPPPPPLITTNSNLTTGIIRNFHLPGGTFTWIIYWLCWTEPASSSQAYQRWLHDWLDLTLSFSSIIRNQNLSFFHFRSLDSDCFLPSVSKQGSEDDKYVPMPNLGKQSIHLLWGYTSLRGPDIWYTKKTNQVSSS